ncbi:MAG: hypothetical protein NW226_09300 [Microscillaceae bacterium]|nr:hypothetical protein [Microscillaceae bacterium]
MKKLLFISIICMGFISRSLSQNNSTLYLIYDSKDSKQKLWKNQTIWNPQRFFYKGNRYAYRYFLFGNLDFSFITLPQNITFEIPIQKLKQYNVWDIKKLENYIKNLNQGGVYTNKGDDYFLNLKKIYIVEIDKTLQKAKFTEVYLDTYTE